MEKYNMQLTAKGLYKKMVNDDINFDCAVQRSLVWDIDKKRKLIHSLLYGFAVPPFYLTKIMMELLTAWMESKGVILFSSLCKMNGT